MSFKRVVLKLSGEALMGKEQSNKVLNKSILYNIANQVKELVTNNIQVGIVIGGGNVFRGRYCDEFSIKREDGDYMGMVATIFNSLAFKACLDSIGVDNVVMSALDIEKVCTPYKAKTANKLLNKKVVIFAAGTGRPYYSTDTCAALRAKEIKADVILMAKNGVDGVYNKDPRKYKSAKKYEFISYDEVLSNKLEVIDLSAISICKENKINLIVFDMDKENAIIDASNGAKIGTLIGEEN